VRRFAIGTLALVHVLGALGAPFAAKLHLQVLRRVGPRAVHRARTARARRTLGPGRHARGHTRALRWLLGDLLTGGAPAIDHWAYGSFLVASLLSLAVLTFSDSRAFAPAPASDA